MNPSDEAVALVKEHYGLNISAKPLDGELDLNFRVEDDAGKTWVLKLHHADTDVAVLELQDTAMFWLEQQKMAGAPTLQAGLNGAHCLEVVFQGRPCFMRLLNWLEGELWPRAKVDALRGPWSLGRHLAHLDQALAQFDHPAADRCFGWNMRYAARHLDTLDLVDGQVRPFVQRILTRFQNVTGPALEQLPGQVIHNDANDNNIIVDATGEVAGLIDYGDITLGHRITELAVAGAYLMPGYADPVAVMLPLVAGYHSAAPLQDAELQLLLDLVRTRIAMSICMAAKQIAADPDNEYLLISQQGFRQLVSQLDAENNELAYYRFRDACGLEANPSNREVVRWLQLQRGGFASICRYPLSDPSLVVEIDLASDGAHASKLAQLDDAAEFTDFIFGLMKQANASVGIGRYLERRGVYKSAAFETADPGERREIHLGVDVFLPAGEPLYAPIDGMVECFANNSDHYDFGPIVILRHHTDSGVPFWTLYGHLSESTLERLEPGQRIPRGELIGWIGNYPGNGDWPPHTHFQILTSLLGMGPGIHGVGNASMLDVWRSICPDPDLILPLPRSSRAPVSRPPGHLLLKRRMGLGRMLSLSYRQPLKIVRGEMQYLYSEDGRRYLDMVNNVCHVGHCHPQVVAAGSQQMAVLNTNTRYLHDNILELAGRLKETLPDTLSVCFFVNSGSEANDLALRLARNYTRRQHVIVLDEAYHGNLTSLVDISPYKFYGRGGRGRPETTRVAELPNLYRGPHRYGEADAASRYAESVSEQIEILAANGHMPAAFIAESLGGVSGQMVYPDGYLESVYQRVRAAGGLCIADEVQVGLGRMGDHFWGFETQQVVPDIVTIGKPLGNGHPLAAVVTRMEIADAFANGMEYFNTFGGNPVSCAIGSAVLDAVLHDNLMQNARDRGQQLKQGLRELQTRFELIGDVRGIGLFVGAELVRDQNTLEPAGEEAEALVNFLLSRDILLSVDGKYSNTLKIKPPVCLDEADVAHFLHSLEQGLRQL